jgi:signal peptidase II
MALSNCDEAFFARHSRRLCGDDPLFRNLSMKPAAPNALVWLIVSAIVIVLDQLTKAWVLTSLPEYTPIPVIEGVWNWYRTYNTGAAFSFLSDAGGWQKYFFVILAAVISGLLAFWLSRTPRRDWRTALPYALVIGGAIGNVIDRVQHGHVIDFIQWHWRDWYWPAFNIADMAIVGGAIGIALLGLLGGQKAPAHRQG